MTDGRDGWVSGFLGVFVEEMCRGARSVCIYIIPQIVVVVVVV